MGAAMQWHHDSDFTAIAPGTVGWHSGIVPAVLYETSKGFKMLFGIWVRDSHGFSEQVGFDRRFLWYRQEYLMWYSLTRVETGLIKRAQPSSYYPLAR